MGVKCTIVGVKRTFLRFLVPAILRTGSGVSVISHPGISLSIIGKVEFQVYERLQVEILRGRSGVRLQEVSPVPPTLLLGFYGELY